MRRLFIGLFATALLGGAASSACFGQSATHPKSWFDAKGACVFPLGPGPLPTSGHELADSLTRGWKARFTFPDAGQIVQTDGVQYPTLDALRIHLGGGIMDPNPEVRDKNTLHPSGKVEGRLQVHDFDLDGGELSCNQAHFGVHMSATDARLDVEHDKQGRPMVMLADAKNATLEFQTSNADLERLLVMDANESASKYGVTVQVATVKLNALNNRSIDVDVHFDTTIAWIPAGLRFQAHVDIDQSMVARLSNLKCDGDEALGPLIVGLIRPGLAKFEGKSKLVFSFPSGQLKLRDVKIQTGEQVKISALFVRD